MAELWFFDKVSSVYGWLGLAASHVDSAMDLGQSNGACSVILVLALILASVHCLIKFSPSPNLVVPLNVCTKL